MLFRLWWRRVLGALPWLPFAHPSDRWNLAADALAAVRMALTAGAEGRRWCAGPKGLGPPSGIMVTVLAARMVHHLATAGGGSATPSVQFQPNRNQYCRSAHHMFQESCSVCLYPYC